MLDHENDSGSAEYAQRVIDERSEDVRRQMINDCPKQWRADVVGLVAVHRREVALQASQGGQRYRRQTPKPADPTRTPAIAANALVGIRAALTPHKEARS